MAQQIKSSIVIGLGKSGLSAIRYLQGQGKPIVACDTREAPPDLLHFQREFPQIPIHLGTLDEKLLGLASEIILSPGIAPQLPVLETAKNNGIPIIGDIELFAQAAKAPIVGITGTNAKGTVTTLVGEMIKNAGHAVLVGGNIGTPALDLLIEKVPDFYVLELSSFQLETTYSLKTLAATILNFSEDHLDRHGTMEAYIAAKRRIYQNCKVAVWNREDKHTEFSGKSYSFGLTVPQQDEFGIREYQDQHWLAWGTELLLPVQKLLIKGRHNWANALAALALGKAIGLPITAMLPALTAFRGLPHRCEWVAEKNQVVWYNDSKGTNVGATLAALYGLGQAISGKLILIAGGLGKGADFSPLQKPVSQFVRSVILFGQDAPLIAEALGATSKIQYAKDLGEAIAFAEKEALANDAVLLSPACASFDMFRDFEDRGEVFKRLVREL